MSKDIPTTELADRCEAASGPDRELDIAIALALPVWTYCDKPGRFFNAGPYYEGAADRIGFKSFDDSLQSLPGNAPDMMMPRFTDSLDAAMTLVPEGHEWLRKSPNTMTVYRRPSDEEWANHIDGAGATPALALCAAALRAQSIARKDPS